MMSSSIRKGKVGRWENLENLTNRTAYNRKLQIINNYASLTDVA